MIRLSLISVWFVGSLLFYVMEIPIILISNYTFFFFFFFFYINMTIN